MVRLKNREVADWDAGDRLTFALAGLAREAAEATKDNLNPIRGFTDDYPTRLLERLDFWMEHIRAVEREVAACINPNPKEES